MGCTVGFTRRGELDAEADVDPVVPRSLWCTMPRSMPFPTPCTACCQGGELDAEADVDILKSSETRTEMKLSADQLYYYELAHPRAEYVRPPARCSRSCPAGAAPPPRVLVRWSGSGLLARRSAAAPPSFLSRRCS